MTRYVQLLASCMRFELTVRQVFTKIYDATSSFRAREDMTTIFPCNLRVGDLVVVESIVVRTQSGNSWRVSYYTDGIFCLARRPPLESKDSVIANPLHVPTVRFPWWL